MVSLEEETLILEKMKAAHISNLSAYLRKMAIDGYVIHVDMKPIREMISLLRRSSNNLNQLAKSCHSYKPFLQQDMDQLQEQYNQLWEMVRTLLGQFSMIP